VKSLAGETYIVKFMRARLYNGQVTLLSIGKKTTVAIFNKAQQKTQHWAKV
jgi:hypothetical protein